MVAAPFVAVTTSSLPLASTAWTPATLASDDRASSLVGAYRSYDGLLATLAVAVVFFAVAEMADWKKPRGKDRALGIAFSDYHESFSAGIAEVSLDRKSGKIRVHHYWIAGDAGIVVQPENAHAQLESAVVYGLSSTSRYATR